MRIILGIILLIFTGCTKFGKNISISGYVRNPVTGQYYADVKIKLMRTDGGLPGGYKDVKVVYTNADGYFELDHFGGYSNYYLGVDLTQEMYILGWFEDGKHVGHGRMNVDKGRSMQPVFEMVEYGYLKYHLRNDNCQGPNDTLQVFLDGSDTGFDDVLIGKLFEQYGCIDITGNDIKYPMGNRYYHYTVIRNGVSQTFYNTVYVPANGTVTYEIFY